jgi:hypothetical protein
LERTWGLAQISNGQKREHTTKPTGNKVGGSAIRKKQAGMSRRPPTRQPWKKFQLPSMDLPTV